MKIKKKHLITILVVLILISSICYYVFTSLNMKMEDGDLLMYSSIELSDENVSQINNSDLVDDISYFDDVWEIEDLNNNDYGNLFELDYHMNLKRFFKSNDYIVECTVDYSGLSDSEKIFFAESTGGIHNQYVFQRNGDTNTAPFYVSFVGCSYGKSEEEIIDISKKLNITLLIQDKNGRIKEKKLNLEKVDIESQEPSESDIESSRDLLGI
jgi:hypothetical protein